MSTAQKNGVAPTSENKNGAAINGIQTVKPQDKVTETPKVTPPSQQVVTLLSQREKNEKLNLLFEREEKLSNTKRDIDRFKLATDESTNSMELKDGKGATFRTCNPSLIKSVIELVMQELAVKQTLIANEIIAIG